MTTYYVRPTNGLDTNAGTSFGAAFQTTQKAADTAVGGDEVRLCNEATETPSARIDFDINGGSASSPIKFVAGDSTDGTPLTTGFYTISGSSLPATTDLVIFNVNPMYIQFERIRFTAATRDGITFGTNVHYVTLKHCRVDGHASDGVYSASTGGHVWLIDTEIDSNTGQGINVNSAGRFNSTIIGGSCHDNGGIGAEIGGDAESVNVDQYEVYDNGGDGIQLIGNGARLSNSTVYGNTGDGVYLSANNARVFNTSSSGNGAYGFSVTSAGDDNLIMDYNHTHNNTSGATDLGGGLLGDNNQTGDPQFTSVVDGSEDFTPANGSPLDSNGINGVDIGARKAVDPAGGGGGCKMAGSSGGMAG